MTDICDVLVWRCEILVFVIEKVFNRPIIEWFGGQIFGFFCRTADNTRRLEKAAAAGGQDQAIVGCIVIGSGNAPVGVAERVGAF